MLQGTIKINGLFLQGENEEEYEEINAGLCSGFEPNNNRIFNTLKFGVEPKIFIGTINIKSMIERVFKRIDSDAEINIQIKNN